MRALNRFRSSHRFALGSLLVLVLLGLGSAASGVARAQLPVLHEVARNPRLGSRLTAIGVDPRDPTRLVLGTEEGSVLVSEDAGLTFDERTLLTARVVSRSSGPPRIEASASVAISGDYRIRADPPYASRPSSRVALVLDPLFFATRPEYMRPEITPSYRTPFTPLLQEVTRTRDREPDPVSHIVSCGSSETAWLVATRTTVFGTDDGIAFGAVFGGARLTIHDLACVDEQHVLLATSEGLFVSSDAGWSYAPASFEGDVSAISVAGGRILIASGRRVFEASSVEGPFVPRYEVDELEAPDTVIRAIARRRNGGFFLATGDGARMQSAPGAPLERVDPGMLDGLELRDALIVDGESGEMILALGRRCARPQVTSTCSSTRLYASVDGAQFEELQAGWSSRSFVQLARSSGGFAALTNGELFASARQSPRASTTDGSLVAWARGRLSEESDLETLLLVVLEALALDEPSIHRAMTVSGDRPWIPIIDARFQVAATTRATSSSRRPQPLEIGTDLSSANMTFLVQLGWSFGGPAPSAMEYREAPTGADRAALYTLSRQISFLVEDAWQERHLALTRLASGQTDQLEAELLRERVVVLDATLNVLSRSPGN